jgi:hypothetical protein
MDLRQPLHNLLEQLQFAIEELSDDQFTMPVEMLSRSTIGQHLRHIIEFYFELDKGYDSGEVNYDKRKRDQLIESDRYFAIQKLNEIGNGLLREDRNLLLVTELNPDSKEIIKVRTNYFRELIYNLEHTVHHMALIRVGISAVSDIRVPDKFGVAASTIKFREACAQ